MDENAMRDALESLPSYNSLDEAKKKEYLELFKKQGLFRKTPLEIRLWLENPACPLGKYRHDERLLINLLCGNLEKKEADTRFREMYEEAKRSNDIALEANEQSKRGNQISLEANELTKEAHKVTQNSAKAALQSEKWGRIYALLATGAAIISAAIAWFK